MFWCIVLLYIFTRSYKYNNAQLVKIYGNEYYTPKHLVRYMCSQDFHFRNTGETQVFASHFVFAWITHHSLVSE